MSAKAQKAATFDVAVAIGQHQRAIELGRKHYKKADRLMDMICEHAKVGEEIPLPGGKKAVLKDNFKDVNKVFRAHGINRFELVIDAA